MKFPRTTSVRLHGDKPAAKRLAQNHLERLLMQFRRMNEFQGLQQNRRREYFYAEDGRLAGMIEMLTTFGAEIINVAVAPPSVPEQPSEQREQSLPQEEMPIMEDEVIMRRRRQVPEPEILLSKGVSVAFVVDGSRPAFVDDALTRRYAAELIIRSFVVPQDGVCAFASHRLVNTIAGYPPTIASQTPEGVISTAFTKNHKAILQAIKASEDNKYPDVLALWESTDGVYYDYYDYISEYSSGRKHTITKTAPLLKNLPSPVMVAFGPVYAEEREACRENEVFLLQIYTSHPNALYLSDISYPDNYLTEVSWENGDSAWLGAGSYSGHVGTSYTKYTYEPPDYWYIGEQAGINEWEGVTLASPDLWWTSKPTPLAYEETVMPKLKPLLDEFVREGKARHIATLFDGTMYEIMAGGSWVELT